MSSCPLLVSLCFQECTGLKTINVVKEVSKYLIHFTVINKTNPPDCDITIDAPGLEKIRIVFSNVRLVHSGTYINLKCLYLMKARLSPDSFNGSLWEFRNDDPFQLWRLEYFTSTKLEKFAYAAGDSVLDIVLKHVAELSSEIVLSIPDLVMLILGLSS